jgi:hypothetical protein
MAFAMRQRKKNEEGGGGWLRRCVEEKGWQHRDAWRIGRGLVAGTGLEPAEAGDARPACYAGDVGKGGERKERPRARGPLWAR